MIDTHSFNVQFLLDIVLLLSIIILQVNFKTPSHILLVYTFLELTIWPAQSVCSSQGRLSSPAPSFLQLPIVFCLGLRPCGIFFIHVLFGMSISGHLCIAHVCAIMLLRVWLYLLVSPGDSIISNSEDLQLLQSFWLLKILVEGMFYECINLDQSSITLCFDCFWVSVVISVCCNKKIYPRGVNAIVICVFRMLLEIKMVYYSTGFRSFCNINDVTSTEQLSSFPMLSIASPC